MIEWLDVLAGAGVAWTSMAIGARWERSRRPKPPKPPKVICQCKHPYVLHSDDGVCHGIHEILVKEGAPIMSPEGTYVVARRASEYEERPCACKRYTGPEPLPEFIP